MVYTTSAYYAARRIPAILRGETPLWGIHLLAYQIRRKFYRERISELTFDFKRGWAGNYIKISPSICKAILKVGIESLIFEVTQNIASLGWRGYPNATLKAAVRCALRHLSLNGIPKEGKQETIDLSWTSIENETGLSPTMHISAFATISRIDEHKVKIVFDYSID